MRTGLPSWPLDACAHDARAYVDAITRDPAASRLAAIVSWLEAIEQHVVIEPPPHPLPVHDPDTAPLSDAAEAEARASDLQRSLWSLLRCGM